MLLQRIYQKQSERLTELLSKPNDELTQEERDEIYQLLFNEIDTAEPKGKGFLNGSRPVLSVN